MLIGVTGYAQHGKDTVANLLVREFGFTRIAFADTLKRMALVLDPIVTSDREPWRLAPLVKRVGWEQAKQNPEVRRFLQVLGTEAVRDNLGADSWVEALDMKRNGIEDVVIPDVRFENEAHYIQSNGQLWGVRRFVDDDDLRTPYDNGIGTTHPSEAVVGELLHWAMPVFEASNVQELEDGVREWMEGRGHD